MGKRRVVQSAEEAQRSNIADQLRAKGERDFESVYGNTQGTQFNLAEDMAAQRGVKMMTQEQLDKNLNAGKEDQLQMPNGVEFTPEVSAAPPELAATELTEEMLPTEIPNPEQKETKQQQEEQLSEDPAKRAEQVAEFLASKFQNAPTADLLQQWRKLHGGIFMLHVADRIFIYRYLKRQEWAQINANPKVSEQSEDDIEENIFNRCMLWPVYNQLQKAGMPAGAVSMVVQQIRLQSLFLDPSYVATLTIKI
jgi:hypothetical protein